MRITRIEVDNFKSLVDLKMDLAKFNCLIGLNGSGKSTLLQFIDFLSQLVRGKMKAWLEDRKWKANELSSKLSPKKNIEFCVQFVDDTNALEGFWKGTFNPLTYRCTAERMEFKIINGNPLGSLEVKANHFKVEIYNFEVTPPLKKKIEMFRDFIVFEYEGSILSVLKEEKLLSALRERKKSIENINSLEKLLSALRECKKFIENINSLDLLSPEYLRQRTRESDGTIGFGGQWLSAYLHKIGPIKCSKLVIRLKKVYPQLEELHVKSLRSGWKQLEILESYQESKEPSSKLKTEARHINDGMLRLIAILAELEADYPFLLFDEIENGINPELVEFVVDALVKTEKQILVTTHSPMILNYLEDNIARSGVTYLYKTPQGYTQAVPFFSIPSLAEKLTVMGPGEAFVDTDLIALRKEIEKLKVVR
jgi:AAA15 family ATPase/GTPase